MTLWKNELKYTQNAQNTSLPPYCLERYDCFFIYKIESGQLKCFKFACKTLQLLIYVGGHSYQLLLHTTKYTILHGRKRQLS